MTVLFMSHKHLIKYLKVGALNKIFIGRYYNSKQMNSSCITRFFDYVKFHEVIIDYSFFFHLEEKDNCHSQIYYFVNIHC